MAENRTQGSQGSQFGGGRQTSGTATRREHSEGAAGVMESVREGAENLASSVGATAGQAWDVTRQTAQEAASKVGDFAESTFEDTTALMRRYPIATLAAGFCLGFLLSLAIRNRSA